MWQKTYGGHAQHSSSLKIGRRVFGSRLFGVYLATALVHTTAVRASETSLAAVVVVVVVDYTKNTQKPTAAAVASAPLSAEPLKPQG